MSEPDRPATTEPSDENWPRVDDPEATRVVPHRPTHSSDIPEHQQSGEPAADSGHGANAWPAAPGGDAPWAASPDPVPPAAEPAWPAAPVGEPAAGPGEPAPQAAHPAWPTSQPTPAVSDGAGPTVVVPAYGSQSTGATAYLSAPTTAYPASAPSGPQQYANAPSGGYPYQPYQPGIPPNPAGPQVIPPPQQTNVVLPPVRMPRAESRVVLNLLGSVIGILLVAGGLILMLRYWSRMRPDPTALADVETLDVLPVVLTIVGVVLIALAALLSAWASWAAIVPGFLLSAASVWAMVTVGPNSGGQYIADATRWAVPADDLAQLCVNGVGLAIGLLLLLAGLAAVVLRAGVRRTIRQQLDSIQA